MKRKEMKTIGRPMIHHKNSYIKFFLLLISCMIVAALYARCSILDVTNITEEKISLQLPLYVNIKELRKHGFELVISDDIVSLEKRGYFDLMLNGIHYQDTFNVSIIVGDPLPLVVGYGFVFNDSLDRRIMLDNEKNMMNMTSFDTSEEIKYKLNNNLYLMRSSFVDKQLNKRTSYVVAAIDGNGHSILNLLFRVVPYRL